MQQQKWDASLYKTKGNFVTNYGESLIELLKPQKNETILDLGCGTGRLTQKISEKADDVYGVDLSESMLVDAQKTYPNIKFKACDAQRNIDFDDNFFDAIFSNAALHWMTDANSVIKNANRILKPKGRFVFEMGGYGNISNLLNSINQVAKDYLVEDYKIKNYYPSISEYSNLLENNGFQVKYAELYERQTLLEGQDWLKNWVKTFRKDLLDKIENQNEFLEKVEQIAKPKLLKNNNWYADYVRLRMITYKL